MNKRTYMIRAVWDAEAQVFYSESDIVGLHIEADTIDEFVEIMHDSAMELVIANHVEPKELAKKRLSDLIPTIFWEKDVSAIVAA